MNKKGILFAGILILSLGVSLVSASLCRNSGGYYYCDGNYDGYRRDYNRGYDYPSYKLKYKTDNYKDTVEYKRTTTSGYKDPYNSEKITTTITEKTTIEKKNKKPIYVYDYPSTKYRDSYLGSRKYLGYEKYSDSPWRFKEPYNKYKYDKYDRDDYDYCIDKCIRKEGRRNRERCLDDCRDRKYGDYYYKPRRDSQGYFNWRW